MKLSHVLNAVYCEPWLIRPAMHAQIAAIVRQHVTGEAHKAGGIALAFDDEQQEDICRIRDDGIAVIAIDGVITKRANAIQKSSGMTDCNDISDALQACIDDRYVTGVVLHVNSPGGSVTGTPELAEEIRAAREVKRVVAYTDTQACSAAYWLGSQAYALIASQSACVGSIGVYLALLDESKRYELNGLKREVVSAGTFKGVGIPGTSLTEAQRGMLQDRVNYIHGQFMEAVNLGRSREIDPAHMQGQTFFGAQAVTNGLADFVGTLNDAIDLAGR